MASRAFLARSESGRRVVLKPLDADCLLQGKLHPSIHARLSRVRELAHPGVANLHGVQMDAGRPWLVWDYVEGTSIVALVGQRKDPRQLTALARELLVAVDALHAVGIVHGAIGGGNVIVDAHGRVKLTHVSPLLHDDPGVDARATAELLKSLARTCGTDLGIVPPNEKSGPSGDKPPVDLRQLRKTLARAGENGVVTPIPPVKPAEGVLRLRPILLALLVLACAIGAFAALKHRAEAVAPPDLNNARVDR